MQVRNITLGLAAACAIAGLWAVTPVAAKTSKCSSILAICLQRAEGHAQICQDMFNEAVQNGQWRATEEPDGTKHAPVPCTK